MSHGKCRGSCYIRAYVRPEPSSRANLVEVKNAVDQAAKEVGTRFDFKGTSAKPGTERQNRDAVRRQRLSNHQVDDILRNKLAKRSVDVRFLDAAKIEKIGGDKVKQVITVRNGVKAMLAKKIQQAIKNSKLKVQAAIQGDSVRVTGAKRDDLRGRHGRHPARTWPTCH